MSVIENTEIHTSTALILEPFGDDGAARFVPVDGDIPARPFILDRSAVEALISQLSEIRG